MYTRLFLSIMMFTIILYYVEQFGIISKGYCADCLLPSPRVFFFKRNRSVIQNVIFCRDIWLTLTLCSIKAPFSIFLTNADCLSFFLLVEPESVVACVGYHCVISCCSTSIPDKRRRQTSSC